eukprot:Amastigsp_a175002_751.p3 type:complete len:113 gc:universal Amastigsp_a175002_751:489-827(+)
MFQTLRRETGSMPVVGSSRKMILGSAQNAMAVERRRRMPPENADTTLSAASSSRSTSRSRSMASVFASASVMPLSAAKSSRCSRAVSSPQRMSCCGQTPMMPRMSRIDECRS